MHTIICFQTSRKSKVLDFPRQLFKLAATSELPYINLD